MAVEAIQIGGTVNANSQAIFVSEMIRVPIRLLAVQVSWDGAAATDTFSVFSTVDPGTPTRPQPGDPPYLRALDIAVRVPSAFSIAIPVPQRRRVVPPVRFVFVYNNTDTTNNRRVSCVIWYDTEE